MGARVVTPVWNGVFTSVGGWLGLCGEYGDMGWEERSCDGVSGVLECLIGKGYDGDMSGDVEYGSLELGDISLGVSPNCGDMSSDVSLGCGDMSSYVGNIS